MAEMMLKIRKEKMEMKKLFIPGHESSSFFVFFIITLYIAFDLLIE